LWALALTASTYYLRRTRTLEFLDSLEKTDAPRAVTVYLPEGLTVSRINDVLKSAGDHTAFAKGLAELIARSRTGGVLSAFPVAR
jgi:hypothetical protein